MSKGKLAGIIVGVICIVAIIVVIVINARPPAQPGESPEARASAFPMEANTEESISFSGVNSTDPDGTIVSYEWDFGDGTIASGITVSHAYSAAGNFTAELTVTDNDGLSETDEVTVMIETWIIEASDGRITIILDRVVKGDRVPRDIAKKCSFHVFGAPTEGYDYVGVDLIISGTENVDVHGIFSHGGEKVSLYDAEGHEYTSLAHGWEFNLVEGTTAWGLFEFPKHEMPMKLELTYSFKEDWEDETEDEKRGQIDIIIPSTLISTPT